MLHLKFSDGLILDSSGPLRLTQQKDGLYVIGQGFLIPIQTIHEGHAIMRDFQNQNSQLDKKDTET